MDGCDVPEEKTGRCGRESYLGWSPTKQSWGGKVCEYHWRKHLDLQDSFNLWDAFGFRRPAGVNRPAPRSIAEKPLPQLAPEPDRGRVVCTEPDVTAEPPQKEPDRPEPQKPEPQPMPATEKPSGCRACGAEREAGHTYCPACARERKKLADRQRQKRRYQKRKILTLLRAN